MANYYDTYLTIAKWSAAVIGAGASYMLGGIDKLLICLLILSGLDIITGLLKGVSEKHLNSKITLQGLIKKTGIYIVIAICHLLDRTLETNMLRDGAVSFYLVMECISITENWGKMGLPLPQKLKDILEQLQDKGA